MGDATDRAAVRLVAGGAGLVSVAVLADSGLEHHRGSFRNPAMYLPLVASTLSMAATGVRGSDAGAGRFPVARGASHAASGAIGLLGLGFHLFNADKAAGRPDLQQPVLRGPGRSAGGADSGGCARCRGDGLATFERRVGPVRLANGRATGALAAVGIVGTVGEAALLHFRGAYHDPFMWAPVVLPPVAAAALARDVVRGRPGAATKGAAGRDGSAGDDRCRLPRLGHPAQHGRLEELATEHPGRSAAAGGMVWRSATPPWSLASS